MYSNSKQITFSMFNLTHINFIHNSIKSYEIYKQCVSGIIDDEWQQIMKQDHGYTEKQIIEAAILEFFAWFEDIKNKYKLHKNQVNYKFKVAKHIFTNEKNQIYNNNILYYAYMVSQGKVEYVERLNSEIQGELQFYFTNRIEDVVPSESSYYFYNNNNNNNNNQPIYNENINININNADITNRVNENITSTETIDLGTDFPLMDHEQNTNSNNINELLQHIPDQNDNNNNDSEMKDISIQNQLNEHEKLELSLDLKEMSNRNVLINNSPNIYMLNKVKNNVPHRKKLKIINKNIAKSNSSVLILHKKTQKNAIQLQSITKMLNKTKKKSSKNSMCLQRIKTKKKRQIEKKQRIFLNLQENKFADDFEIIVNVDTLKEFLATICYKDIGNEIEYKIKTKKEWNCITNLQRKYKLFDKFHYRNYKENQENILKCTPNMQFDRCVCDPICRSLDTENKRFFDDYQCVFIKTNENGYELLDNEYGKAKKYIISQDYKKIEILGYFDIEFDTFNSKFHSLKQTISIKQQINDNMDDSLEEFSQISSINES